MKEVGFVVDFAIKPKSKDCKKEKPRKEKETRIKLDTHFHPISKSNVSCAF